ncbi:MAG: hypothetical protein JOS17DRAFT_473104 [Linnemannia elongata]|nr:MAG: hypothetical protein JOS17DRAFT_473104 [Linnemannia elongata]
MRGEWLDLKGTSEEGEKEKKEKKEKREEMRMKEIQPSSAPYVEQQNNKGTTNISCCRLGVKPASSSSSVFSFLLSSCLVLLSVGWYLSPVLFSQPDACESLFLSLTHNRTHSLYSFSDPQTPFRSFSAEEKKKKELSDPFCNRRHDTKHKQQKPTLSFVLTLRARSALNARGEVERGRTMSVRVHRYLFQDRDFPCYVVDLFVLFFHSSKSSLVNDPGSYC